MSIVLDHTIVRARDKARSARFFAKLLGLEVGAVAGPFVPVRVNAELTFDFDDRNEFTASHYAFLLDNETFDQALARIRASTVEYGSGRFAGWDHAVDDRPDGRTVYVRDQDGHSYELIAPSR